MIKRICDRCKREETKKDIESFNDFAKILFYDFCPKCQQEFYKNLHKFVLNQTEVNPNEQEKASNT